MDVSGFMPHGHCILWSPSLLSLHVAADGIIALSYFSIPLAIVFYVKKKQTREKIVPLLFTAFILSCGITHLFTIWNWWNTDYWLSGGIKILCGAISATTAVVLWFLMPQALKIPTSRELEEINSRLKTLNEDLESEVAVRTHSLEEANRKLKALSENRANFFSSMTHEIKNHLNAISLSTEYINMANEKAEVEKASSALLSNTHALSAIISDLLELREMEVGRIKVKNASFSPKKLLEELALEFSTLAKQKGLEFGLMQGDLPGEIVSDEVRVRQILVNLLSNAVKYTERGKIELECALSQGLLEFKVSDTGRGVDPENFEKIFSLYERSERDGDQEGSGIGLALSSQIASVLGGKLSLERSCETGSVFVFKLPLTQSPA